MKAAPLINNFSAGEFGPLASARTDLDRYGASQELCQNFIPRVQGGAVKREATKYVAATKSNGVARLEKFIFSNENAYVLEFGNLYIRFYTDGGQITDAGNAVEVTTTYAEADLFELSFCQSNDILYIFHKDYEPKKLIRNSDTNWTMNDLDLINGPYISYYSFANGDPAISVSAATGSITIQTSSNNITNCTNFVGEYLCTHSSTSLLKTGDRVYVSGLTSATGSTGTWTITVRTNTTFTLDSSVYVADATTSGTYQIAPFFSNYIGKTIRAQRTGYGIASPEATWGTAQITAYTNGATVTAQVIDTFTSTSDKTFWSISGYSESIGNPSSGCFHEERLFLAGPRQFICGSVSSDYENFSPSDPSGVIVDSDSVSFNLSSNDTNNIRWVVSDEKGILAGTNANEWLVKSSSTQEPITPTSITAKKTTSFGSQSIQPVQAGKATIFAQGSGRKIREFNYFYDVDGFRCNDVTQLAHHICEGGVKQLALSKQPEQIVWAVRNDGQLIGMTYERDIDGLRVAWHRHIIGGVFLDGDAVVESIASIPTSDNSYDEIWLVVKRTINGATKRYVEYIGKPFNTEVDQEDAFFVDCGLTYDSPKTMTGATKANPIVISSTAHGFANGDLVRFDEVKGMTDLNGSVYRVADQTANTFELTTYDGTDINSTSFGTYVSGGEIRKLVTTISGLTHLEGQTVQACGDGIDLGDYTVSSGAITLSEPSAVVHVGLGYDSKIKLQRIDAGSQDGTSLGKTRRIHRLGVMLHRTLGLKYGQDFDDMKQFEFSSGNDQLNEGPPLFTGIISQETDFQYDTENKICLMSDRPTPCTLLAVMPLMQTQDR